MGQEQVALLPANTYLLEFGFNPIIFEVDNGVGGLRRHTMESTKLQNTKPTYQFIDFPWPSSVKEHNPSHNQVLDYLKSYAEHFSLISYIRFNSKVINIDYVGESSEEMKSWELWGCNGRPFCSKGTWHIVVQDTKNLSIEVCIYSLFSLVCYFFYNLRKSYFHLSISCFVKYLLVVSVSCFSLNKSNN